MVSRYPHKFCGRYICRSKDKVTVAFNAKTVTAQYLEKFISDSHFIW